ncbi:MAG: Peptidyl-prolyl cis-trans isomerase [Planctomycetota bacterium]|jgi:peptidyl-prolyl cis-trans isomerase B (cyclophilin B)
MAYPTATIGTEFGDIEVELWDDVAPGHVANFQKLARKGFYDGVGFHRIIPGFVIQGGCPQGTGTGGPGWQVKAEFNKRPHQPGTLSMARSADPDSAGSQFFICLTREQCQHLDGQYTGFGQVTKGMEIVKKIAAVPVDRNGRPSGSLPKMTMVTAPEPTKKA